MIQSLYISFFFNSDRVPLEKIRGGVLADQIFDRPRISQQIILEQKNSEFPD